MASNICFDIAEALTSVQNEANQIIGKLNGQIEQLKKALGEQGQKHQAAVAEIEKQFDELRAAHAEKVATLEGTIDALKTELLDHEDKVIAADVAKQGQLHRVPKAAANGAAQPE